MGTDSIKNRISNSFSIFNVSWKILFLEFLKFLLVMFSINVLFVIDCVPLLPPGEYSQEMDNKILWENISGFLPSFPLFFENTWPCLVLRATADLVKEPVQTEGRPAARNVVVRLVVEILPQLWEIQLATIPVRVLRGRHQRTKIPIKFKNEGSGHDPNSPNILPLPDEGNNLLQFSNKDNSNVYNAEARWRDYRMRTGIS